MSLDVSLCSITPVSVKCYSCGHSHDSFPTNYDANITHNLGTMASEAGLYDALWRPENINAVYASDIIPTLERGLIELIKNPDKYKQFNPSNGWGDYDNLVEFTRKYLDACRDFPNNTIHVSR